MKRNGSCTIDSDQPVIKSYSSGESLEATSPHTEFRVLGNVEAFDDGKRILPTSEVSPGHPSGAPSKNGFE